MKTQKNKKYKTVILKIQTRNGESETLMNNISIEKIKTDDVIKSIDNLEHVKLNNLNLPEDESFLTYGRDIVIKNYDEFIKSNDYKKTISYLKDNSIDEN